MITTFLIIACVIAGLLVGHYATLFSLQSKASRLITDLKASYPREFEIWKCGYKQALNDIFE